MDEPPAKRDDRPVERRDRDTLPDEPSIRHLSENWCGTLSADSLRRPAGR
jgi:hypothetical protein